MISSIEQWHNGKIKYLNFFAENYWIGDEERKYIKLKNFMNDTEYKIKSYNACSLWKLVYAHMIRYVWFFVYLSDLHSMKQIFVSLHAKNYVCFFKKIRIFLIDLFVTCVQKKKNLFIFYIFCVELMASSIIEFLC